MAEIRVVFSGAKGRMGQALLPGLREASGIAVVGEVDKDDDLAKAVAKGKAQVVVDFTVPKAAVGNARAILKSGAQGVIGTTGFTEADLDALDAEAKAAGRGLVIAPNFALGAVLVERFAEEAVRHYPRVEVIEAHHETKADAPSGTAQRAAERLARAGARPPPDAAAPSRGGDVKGVRVHSLRLPGLVARQEVHFGGPGEALVLRHDAFSRDCYLPGVLAAIRWVPGRVGLVRGLESILFPRR
jgi:4-hydroxy-tetrahydrodipicolinate reductase